MSLDARRRSSIYEKLIPLIGEQNANALMSEFPSVEADELVTKQFLRAELSELRGEMAVLRSDLLGRVDGQGTELGGETARLGAELRAEIADFRAEVAEQFHQATLRFGAALAGATALVVAAIPLLS